MQRDASQKQSRRVRMSKPVGRPAGRHLVLQGPPESRHQRVDAAWPPRGEQLAAGHVDEHQRSVHVTQDHVGARIAELPQVLAVEPVHAVGHVDPPRQTALDPLAVRMLAGDDVDVRRVAPARDPITVQQPERLAKTHAAALEQLEQQPVANRPDVLAARRVQTGARVLDQRHLPRREDRRDLPSRRPHPHRLGRSPAPSGHMLEQRPELR